MDKYVQRQPTWKTKDYGTIVATSSQKKEHPSAENAKKRRLLQENLKANAKHRKDVDSAKSIKMKHMDLLADFTSHKNEQSGNMKSQSPSSSDLDSRVEVHLNTCRVSLKFGTPSEKNCVKMTSEAKHNTPYISSTAPICNGPETKAKSDLGIENYTPESHRFKRLQSDLNSPSALARVRAMKALNCPTKTGYDAFDVPHAEQSLIFDKDRTPEAKPTLREILKKVIIYVEVRTGQDDRSEGVKSIISKLGAQVNDRLLRNTTHVIFKDGRRSTYNKAINWKIPIVSILWIEACKLQCKLCDPEKFPISNRLTYEYPELYPKLPRTRYMQPDSELNRPRKRHCTPTRVKESETDVNSGKKAKSTPTPSTPVLNKNANITDFFRPTSYNKQICAINEEVAVESPGTRLLNRISNGLFMSAQKSNSSNHKSDKEEPKTSIVDGESNPIQTSTAQRGLSLNENTENDTPKSKRQSCIATTERTTRRRSSMQIANIETSEPRITERSTRRHSLLHIAGNATEGANIETPEPLITERTSRRRSSLQIPNIETPQPRVTKQATRRRSSLHVAGSLTEKTNIETPEPRITECATRRRNSLQITKSSTEISTPEPRLTRRRSMTANTVLNPTTPNVPKKSLFETVVEEPMAEAVENNKTNYSEESLEMSGLNLLDEKTSCKTAVETVTKNLTNCAEQSLQISGLQTDIEQHLAKRPTVHSIASMEISSECATVSRQTSSSSIDGEHTPVPVFSSTRLPGSASSNRRRTIYNMDLEFVNERINSINNIAQRRSMTHHLDKQMEGEFCSSINDSTPQAVPVITDKTTQTQKESNSEQPKMRKLFVPNDEIIITPPKSTKRSRLSVNATSSCDSTQKRRRTLIAPAVNETNNTNENKSLSTQRNEACNSIYVKTVGRRSTLDFEQPNKLAAQKKTGMQTNIEVVGDNNGGQSKQATEANTSADLMQPKTPCSRNIRKLVHTNMRQSEIQVIHQALLKLRGVRLEKCVTKRTTHLVSLEPRRTLNLLRGLIRGVWILDFRWIQDSLQAGKWVNEEPYEMTSFSRAVEICRIERQAFGIQYRCDLFKYMESFFVSTQCRPIPSDNVKELLLLGGAKLTNNRFKARYIIGDKQRVEDDRIYLNPNWLLDSITAMQIQRFGKYLMQCAIVTPVGIRYEVAKPSKIENELPIV